MNCMKKYVVLLCSALGPFRLSGSLSREFWWSPLWFSSLVVCLCAKKRSIFSIVAGAPSADPIPAAVS